MLGVDLNSSKVRKVRDPFTLFFVSTANCSVAVVHSTGLILNSLIFGLSLGLPEPGPQVVGRLVSGVEKLQPPGTGVFPSCGHLGRRREAGTSPCSGGTPPRTTSRGGETGVGRLWEVGGGAICVCV